jgi:hypothetical protein
MDNKKENGKWLVFNWKGEITIGYPFYVDEALDLIKSKM